ncbi:tectonic-3-like isoform X2 [Paramisgurnus dabryanus]|uniref:tectonic-3-like isoform X2 n=1 Tax=Paramisgurnus dabryanus TaxID=90735 RepID=UPI0031F44829
MSTHVFRCILILNAFIFRAVTNFQDTQNVTVQTPVNTDLSEYIFNVTDIPPASTYQSPTATPTTFRAESNSLVPSAVVDPNATLTDGIGVYTNDSITKHITNPTEAATSEIRTESNSSVSSATSQPNATFTDGVAHPTDVYTRSITTSSGCLCDVTPDFCDIGCCCDGIDCGLLNLSSVFNDCNQALGSGTCLESWMMFTANINPLLVTRSGDLFCVQKEEEMQSDVQTSPAVYQSIYLYPLLLREPAAFNIQKNNFYKVDDIILIYFNRTSIVSTLRQPSTGPASSACVNRNPARFLRSSSLSCSRTVTTQSCVEDNSLSARTYYTGFSLLRVPQAQVETRPELLIPISTVRDWPEPREQNGSCFNVVSKVEYGIEYTGKGEIVKITMNAELITANPNTQFLQTHTVTFQLATSTPSMTTPTPVSGTEGLKSGSPVIVWFGGKSQPLTVLRSSENGECLARPANRSPVFFKQNVMTGCTFRSSASDCGVLRAELMEVLSAAAVPELISMTTGDQAEKSKVILQDCSLPASELCETGCMLPISLSVQVLWAQRGLRALPQNHILGAKFVFSCDRLKCPLRSSIPVTAGVVFTETTVYPEAPRGEPKPEWKFPFAFFTGGAGEFDQE